MKIYFDVSSMDPRKVTGIGVYMLQVFRHLKNEKNVEMVPVLKPSRFKRKKLLEQYLGCPVQLLWPWTGCFEKNAIYHGPDFKMNIGKHLPRVVSVHDLVVFEGKYNRPEFYQKGIADLTKVLNSDPTAVITISEFTKSQIAKHFPLLKERTHVTLLGCDRTKSIANSSTNSGAAEPLSNYILFLGTLEKRKNIVGVIKSFEILCQQGRSENLVLAGTWGFGAEEIQEALAKSPVRERITHLNYVPDERVPGLFKNARVFVFPSWYEGFGLPVLEAMALGCPVVTASGGALEEITGGAALLAPPDQPAALAAEIHRVLSDENLRQDLIARGYNQAAKFTWQKCAQETLAIYSKVRLTFGYRDA